MAVKVEHKVICDSCGDETKAGDSNGAHYLEGGKLNYGLRVPVLKKWWLCNTCMIGLLETFLVQPGQTVTEISSSRDSKKRR